MSDRASPIIPRLGRPTASSKGLLQTCADETDWFRSVAGSRSGCSRSACRLVEGLANERSATWSGSCCGVARERTSTTTRKEECPPRSHPRRDARRSRAPKDSGSCSRTNSSPPTGPVVDVPAALAARTRLLGNRRTNKNDSNDALSVAVTALRHREVRTVTTAGHSDCSPSATSICPTSEAGSSAPSTCSPTKLSPSGIAKRLNSTEAGARWSRRHSADRESLPLAHRCES